MLQSSDELKTDADSAASEREEEIRTLYEQRREELDEELEAQQKEVQKWNRKARNARNKSTRNRYLSKRQEAKQELEQLEAEIEERKEELRKEEQEQISTTTARYAIDVDVISVGTTVVTYDRGHLTVEIEDEERVGETTVVYTPATIVARSSIRLAPRSSATTAT